MAETAVKTRRPFNRPRWNGADPSPYIPTVQPNHDLLREILAILDPNPVEAAKRAVAFMKRFAEKRFSVTGWRRIADISSKDTKVAAEVPGERATKLLDKPFHALTTTLAAKIEELSNGEVRMDREQTLSVIAALAEDQALLDEAGVRIWNAWNANLQYPTLGLSALERGQIPPGAREQAMDIAL